MASQKEHIRALWQLYLTDQAGPEQVNELFAYLKDPANDAAIDEQFQRAMQESGLSASFTPHPERNISSFESLLAARRSLREARENKESSIVPSVPAHRVHFLRRPWFRYAAIAVVLVIGAITAFIVSSDRQDRSSKNAIVSVASDILPGSNGAVLTLSDGSTIVLDSLKNGIITRQGNTAVKIENGQLVYDANAPGPVAYNTMATPKGRQFRLVLPDGSQVWLNAGSSITYPTVFSGPERKVSITGEAYFEVARNASLPFIVSIDRDNTVEVLGTNFNINAYKDEGRIRTTLLDGKVRVVNKTGMILEPGEQAISTPDGPLTIDHSPDLEQIMAWKNGIFYFRNAGLPTVMNQLKRWYDIDIQYTGQLPVLKISGKMDRGLSLQEIMDFMAKMDVKYTISGRTVIVHGN